MIVETRAPGKLILLGEYAVLEHAPALVMAVDRYATVRINPLPNRFHRLHSPTLNLSGLNFQFDTNGQINFRDDVPAETRQQLRFFTHTLELTHGANPKGFSTGALEFVLNTDSFFLQPGGSKLGLGSSAALTVALTTALFFVMEQGNGEMLEKFVLLKKAQNIHHQAQEKKGSGIDIAASVFGGVLTFRIAGNSGSVPEISPTLFPPDLHLIPVWSGKSASTGGFIKKTVTLKQENPEKYWQSMNELIHLTRKGCTAFQAGETEQFLKACRLYSAALDHFGKSCQAEIISPEHREIAGIVEKHGGVYKPSGAGGGDIGIALTRSEEVAEKIITEILHSPYKIIKLSPSPNGVSLRK
ncbi:MAG TPA: hypothetical protein ENK14_13600 [Caldithrix sp.]|nr:hypothetical protein [Caldithrix sp.]